MTLSSKFIIYAKPKEGGRFQALDLGTGSFVSKLFYASLVTEIEAERILHTLTTENSAYVFEARTPDGTRTLKAKAVSYQPTL